MIAAILIGVLAVLLNFVQTDGIKKMEVQLLERISLPGAAHQGRSDQEAIFDATVEIKMAFQPPHSKKQENKLLATGLGSLVRNGSETLLITHNHWGEVLTDTTVITFYDVDHQVLKIMLGKEFKNLVVFRDEGTLVLEAPEELLGLDLSSDPRIGASEKVKSGTIVQVVYHQTGNRSEIGLLKAEVEAIGEYQGLPVYILRSLNGNPIIEGDSGGGIWQDGRLVGNMWATITKTTKSNASSSPASGKASSKPTDISYAAMLP